MTCLSLLTGAWGALGPCLIRHAARHNHPGDPRQFVRQRHDRFVKPSVDPEVSPRFSSLSVSIRCPLRSGSVAPGFAWGYALALQGVKFATCQAAMSIWRQQRYLRPCRPPSSSPRTPNQSLNDHGGFRRSAAFSRRFRALGFLEQSAVGGKQSVRGPACGTSERFPVRYKRG